MYMARKELVALYGRLGMVMAVFVFIIGIIAGPILHKTWFSRWTVTERANEHAAPSPKPSTALPSEKQG